MKTSIFTILGNFAFFGEFFLLIFVLNFRDMAPIIKKNTRLNWGTKVC
jgi:hypothetical protein